jgi:hypothetical protein
MSALIQLNQKPYLQEVNNAWNLKPPFFEQSNGLFFEAVKLD